MLLLLLSMVRLDKKGHYVHTQALSHYYCTSAKKKPLFFFLSKEATHCWSRLYLAKYQKAQTGNFRCIDLQEFLTSNNICNYVLRVSTVI